MRPMLAVPAAELPRDTEHWGHEMKWDGMRALLVVHGGQLRILTRTGNDATTRFPELAALAAVVTATTGPGRTVLDGEIVMLDDGGRPSFAKLQPRMHLSSSVAARQRATEEPAVVMLFDVLELDGTPTIELPYLQRRELLERLKLEGPTWRTPPSTPGNGPAVLDAAQGLGLEGVVAKRLDSRYLPGTRSDAWRKVKLALGQELVVGGWLAGNGRLETRLGSLLVGYHDAPGGTLHYAGRVGSGINEQARTLLEGRLAPLARDTSPFATTPRLPGPHWVDPVLVVEVVFHEWTPDGVMRAPRYRGLRVDRDPADVVREDAVDLR